jgi:2-amino-4-hydroxy-6-hydroxymethyldihydropteridine diphosphokinase
MVIWQHGGGFDRQLAPKDMILVGLGSSLPFCGHPPQEILLTAIAALGRLGRLGAVSRLYASPAWPDPADPSFVNAVAVLETGLSPAALLAALHAIEAGFGRRRTREYGPRTLDLDLLDYDGLVRTADASSALVLPHPGIASRDFVLRPLAEVAPGWIHPVTGKTVEALLGRLESRSAEPLPAA